MINVLSLLCFDLALLRAQFLHPAFCLSMELIWISYLDVSSKWICILKMSLFSSSKIALFCVPLSVGAPPLGKATASGFTTAPYCTPLLQPFHHQLLSPTSWQALSWVLPVDHPQVFLITTISDLCYCLPVLVRKLRPEGVNWPIQLCTTDMLQKKVSSVCSPGNMGLNSGSSADYLNCSSPSRDLTWQTFVCWSVKWEWKCVSCQVNLILNEKMYVWFLTHLQPQYKNIANKSKNKQNPQTNAYSSPFLTQMPSRLTCLFPPFYLKPRVLFLISVSKFLFL